MSSDDAYASFLDKANQDTGAAKATQQAQEKHKTTSMASRKDVHPAIASVDAYYVSETDAPFEPVSLVWDRDEPLGIASFEELLSTDADVVSLTPKEFDPKSQYTDVVKAVGQAGDGAISIFKVDFGGTRLEYYVVSITRDKGFVQGLKAMAIES